MTDQPKRPPYYIAWCFGGFLFPAAIMGIGLTFERQQPPNEAELARASVHPDLLSNALIGLALAHAGAGFLAVVLWPTRVWVWVATGVQFACTLYAWFGSNMAVQGAWL